MDAKASSELYEQERNEVLAPQPARAEEDASEPVITLPVSSDRTVRIRQDGRKVVLGFAADEAVAERLLCRLVDREEAQGTSKEAVLARLPPGLVPGTWGEFGAILAVQGLSPSRARAVDSDRPKVPAVEVHVDHVPQPRPGRR